MTAPPAPPAFTGWLGDRVPGLTPPLRLVRVGAGQSNITSVVTDADGREWVLRHPPAGAPAGSHDVHREARVLRALVGSGVPVPTVVAEGTDAGGVDGPFYVMDRSPGAPLVDEPDASACTPRQRRELSVETVEVLARLHALDPAAVGLQGLGRPTGFLERQTARTVRNWAAWGEGSAATPAWEECRRRITASVPRQQRTVITHGDYRLSNLLVRDGRITAVLDWELCTLGDPLADLAWLLDDWRSPQEPAIVIPRPTRAGGFAARAEIVDAYAARTGLDVGDLDHYCAFTHWKAATLLQGVLVRRRSGSMGEHGALDLHSLQDSVEHLLDGALRLLGR